jgi:2,4-diaminopentanoate dehydrogenase
VKPGFRGLGVDLFPLSFPAIQRYCSATCMQRTIKVAQIGLGPIGLECLKAVAALPWARVVGAVDIRPARAGVSLGALTGIKKLRPLTVVQDVTQLDPQPDLVFHTAVSSFKDAYLQLEPLARRGIHVVSSCEQMIFPKLREPALARKLNLACERSGSRVVATGVNPGFVMDLLPLCLTSITRSVREIHVQRIVDASTRREPLQRKIGSGLPPAQFRKLLRAGQAGHAGLRESLALLAHALGHMPTRIIESADAIVADRDLKTRYFRVQKGQTCGLHQRATAAMKGRFRLTLDLKMYLGAESPCDAIQIIGTPPIQVRIEGGIAGDEATVAALVNITPRLMRAGPGLRLITELPLA